jgi:hypothetical protein
MQIGRKIYYDKATGNIIVDTGERSGNVVETTIEQDFTTYSALAERIPETVGMIQLDYGQFLQDFAECNGVRVNPTTLELEFSYPIPGEPGTTPVLQKPLSVEVEELKAEVSATKADNLNTMDALFDVYLMVLDMQGGTSA